MGKGVFQRIVEFGQPTDERQAEAYRRIRETTAAMFAIGAFGQLVVLIYALQYPPGQAASVLSVGWILSAAAGMVGALLGFLFGIPRALSGSGDAGSRVEANTNLEQISDWLTKILVGVGLTQITTIGRAFGDLVVSVAPALGGEESSEVMAGAIVVFMSAVGFITGYLWTRLYVQSTFQLQADADIDPQAPGRARLDQDPEIHSKGIRSA